MIPVRTCQVNELSQIKCYDTIWPNHLKKSAGTVYHVVLDKTISSAFDHHDPTRGSTLKTIEILPSHQLKGRRQKEDKWSPAHLQ